MRRLLLVLGLVLGLGACGGENGTPSDIAVYEEALDEQSELMARITEVLDGVTDEASAKEAAPRIEALSAELQRLAVRMNALPPLPFDEQERLTRERASSAAARRESGRQMLKIEHYPVLREAWQRGMQGAG